VRPVLTEIHLRHACSCQEIEAGNAPPGRRRQALVASIVDSAVVAAHEAEHTAGWVLGLALERALDIGAEPQVRTRDTFTHRNGSARNGSARNGSARRSFSAGRSLHGHMGGHGVAWGRVTASPPQHTPRVASELAHKHVVDGCSAAVLAQCVVIARALTVVSKLPIVSKVTTGAGGDNGGGKI
jgi:hypothetical protein